MKPLRQYSDHGSEEFCKFAKDQLSCWPLARDNFRALKNVQTREINVRGVDVKVQLNPSRVASTKVDTSEEAIAARPCFLCLEHRPRQQKNLDFEGAKGKRYRVQLNPYPIFPEHFVIPADHHSPQLIWHRIVDMLRLCKRHRDFTFMYNGPKCGASVPDHFHFQAIPRASLPLETAVLNAPVQATSPAQPAAPATPAPPLQYITSLREARLYRFPGLSNGIFVIKGRTSKSVAKLFYRLLDCTPTPAGDREPRFNLFSLYTGGEGYTTIVVLRTSHRSHHYFTTDPAEHLTMSPGCADMGGVMITVSADDFAKLDANLLGQMLDEITISSDTQDLIIHRLTRTQPPVSVELGHFESLEFEVVSDGAGRRRVSVKDGRIEYGGMLYDELFFEAKTSSTMFAGTSFIMYGETVCGHYPGALKISVSGASLKVENIVGMQDLAACVLSCDSSDYADASKLSDKASALCSELMAAPSVQAAEIAYCGLPENRPEIVAEVVDSLWK